MNPIGMLLMACQKLYQPPRCLLCLDKHYTLKPWKRGSEWTYEKVPCACQKKEDSHA